MKFKDCKDFENIPVIYGIKNTITNKWYIGSCKDFHNRFRRHLSYLKRNAHHSQKLQRSYNLHGEDAFEIYILKELTNYDISEMIMLENDAINKYDSINNGYNMIPAVEHLESFKLSKEANEKARISSYKPVVCLDRYTGKFVKEYPSISSAAEELGMETTNISNVCNPNSKLTYLKDYTFVYKDDYDPNKDYTVLHPRGRGVPKREDWKLHMKQNHYLSKRVYKYDLEGTLICEYLSRSEAEREEGFKKEFLRTRIDKEINGYIYSHTQR